MRPERVIVALTPEFLGHNREDIFAARYRELGLTAYGRTHDGALASLKRLLRTCIRTHRTKGTLERFLDDHVDGASGSSWCWESEYPGDGRGVEYLDGPGGHENWFPWVPAAADAADSGEARPIAA